MEGTCGAPCLTGTFASKETRDDLVAYPDIAHMNRQWVICPPHLSGYVELSCKAGIVGVVGNGTCGDRCSPKFLKLYGVELNSPVMEHNAELVYSCNQPGFNGQAKVRCEFG